jgi:hypothetical protein
LPGLVNNGHICGWANDVLEHKQNPLAMKVLEKVATYEASIKKTERGVGQDGTEESERLIAEYYVLRTALVCSPLTRVTCLQHF